MSAFWTIAGVLAQVIIVCFLLFVALLVIAAVVGAILYIAYLFFG